MGKFEVISTVVESEEVIDNILNFDGYICFRINEQVIYHRGVEIVYFWHEWLDMIKEFKTSRMRTTGYYYTLKFYLEESEVEGVLHLTIDYSDERENELYKVEEESLFKETVEKSYETFKKLDLLESAKLFDFSDDLKRISDLKASL